MVNKNAPVENKMGTMPVLKLIFNMSLPIMFSMLVMALYNIVDSIFVGKICDEALAAVSLAFPIQNLMVSFAVGTAVGVNALLSLRLGQKNQRDVNKTAMNGVFLSVVTWIVFAAAGTLISSSYLKSQTDNSSVIHLGEQYLEIILILGFGQFIGGMFDRLLQSTGRTFLSMISQLIGAVFNIIFDPILIFGLGPFPELGIRGAALATVLGQILGCLVSFILNILKNHDIQFKFSNILPNKKIIAQIYRVAVPAILMSSITSVVTYFLNLIFKGIENGGDNAITVYGIYFKLNSFIFMPVFGLNNGIVPIIAYNYGAEHKKRILKTIKYSLLVAFCIMFFGVIIFESFPDVLFRMFTDNEVIIQMGKGALRKIAPSFFGAAIAITLSAIFQAFSAAFFSLLVSFLRQIVVFLPAAYFLGKTGDVNNVWWCFIIAEFMSVLVSVSCMRNIYRKKISVMEDYKI
ncbi:MAG: MATE family efflux transporter [Spirochaetia bacterium]|nr:MATE family efflux transporter [Spirochaetia bacterium]